MVKSRKRLLQHKTLHIIRRRGAVGDFSAKASWLDSFTVNERQSFDALEVFAV